jgi:hypothetical protein
MRHTFLGLITAFAIAVAACGDDSTGRTNAAVVGDAPAQPVGTEGIAPPPAPPPPATTGQPNTELPPTVPRPDPPCTHCPNAGTIIITPAR